MPQFDPLNEKLKKLYEESLTYAGHREHRTVDATWKSIVMFETATGRKPFTSFSTEQAKAFRHYLEKQTTEKGDPLSLASMRSHLANVRAFFLWLRMHPKVGKKINGQATEYLHLSRNEDRAARASKPRQVPTIDQMRQAIAAMPHETELEKRDRAVIALAACTAARDAALISLRLEDVDVANRTVWQNPKHVRTKYRKGINTTWVPVVPEWEEIVVQWVEFLRQEKGFGDKDPLFPLTLVELNPDKQEFEEKGLSSDFWKSAAAVRAIFRKGFERVGLPYFHPHTCRHMLTNWMMENGSQQEFKALSQNLGHEHVMTTYNSYGSLSVETQRKLIRNIGQRNDSLAGVTDDELWAEMARRRKV
ncbi:MAG: recombinase XerC [Pseudomonas fluorescens]|nr:MAG: recombinase XerC [Pseudomonas fluorescens]